ncbi:MmyB family transcriptional regulator [Streptomyces griseofuscus]
MLRLLYSRRNRHDVPGPTVHDGVRILARTPEMARPLPGFEAVPPSRRNAMWLCLLHPAMRGFYADREQVLRDMGAHLRAVWAAHPQDRELSGLNAEFDTRTRISPACGRSARSAYDVPAECPPPQHVVQDVVGDDRGPAAVPALAVRGVEPSRMDSPVFSRSLALAAKNADSALGGRCWRRGRAGPRRASFRASVRHPTGRWRPTLGNQSYRRGWVSGPHPSERCRARR